MSSGAGPPSPREWVGRAPFPWPPARELRAGLNLVACYAVAAVRPLEGGPGSPSLLLELSDASGRIGAVIAGAEPAAWLRAGAYIGIRGTVESVAGQPRIRVEMSSPLRVALDELEWFLPRSLRDPAELEAELSTAIDSVREPALHSLVARLLGRDSEIGRGFRLAPAATRNHHAYLGGLLEHTLSVTRLCDSLAAHYGLEVDRDLLVTAALLHDIGKVREIGAQIGFPYTDEGRLLGHILLGLRMIDDAAAHVPALDPARLLLLQHLVASHQGRYEWQSPREPRILEAILLHYVDDLDAKVHHALRLLGGVSAGWTEYDRSLGRELLRHHPSAHDSGATDAVIAPPPPRSDAEPARRKRTAAKRKARSRKTRSGTRGRHGARSQAQRTRTAPRPGSSAQITDAPVVFVDKDTLDLFA